MKKLTIIFVFIGSFALAQPGDPGGDPDTVIAVYIPVVGPMISIHIPYKWFNFIIYPKYKRRKK